MRTLARLLALVLVALSVVVVAAGLGFMDEWHRTLSLYGGGWVARPAVADAAPIWVVGIAGIAIGLAYLWLKDRRGARNEAASRVI